MDLSEKFKYTVLIIDDEKVILDLTSIILTNRGYAVLTANDPLDGLKMLEKHRPELVLLDYMMPKMDGLTVLREIKQRFPETYVIMFTGKGSEEIAVELMKAGASDYVLKPFNNQDLADRISHVLKVREVELRNHELLKERESLLDEIEAWNQELENRVLEKTEALRKAQAEIVQTEKLATLGYLSAGMAHEIRNPLNSITLFIQLIRGGIDEAEKLDYIDKILKEVDRIDGIIRKLLDASKRPRFEIKEVIIDKTIQSTLEMFSHQIEMSGIILEKQFIKIPPPIQADPAEIEQIFTNLFVNSIQEMQEGGRLRVTLDCDSDNIIITVADTGRGIPEENLNKIFDPFFTTKASGTGLGLSVVLRIVKTYQGRIEVTSSPSGGTMFNVTLPLAGR